jgi:hypothetical protein
VFGEFIDVPAAIAISGAAVSPAMGKRSVRSIQALLAIANVRLGVWLPNPHWVAAFTSSDDYVAARDARNVRVESAASSVSDAEATLAGRMGDATDPRGADGLDPPADDQDRAKVDRPGWLPESEKSTRADGLRAWWSQFLVRRAEEAVARREKNLESQMKSRLKATSWTKRVRITYLFREIFGIYRMWDRFLYISDGGHWEDLGLVELLRRGCTEIYCFDGTGTPAERFHSLAEAIAIARTDLGVEFDATTTEIIEALRPSRIPLLAGDRLSVAGTELSMQLDTRLEAPASHAIVCFEYPNGRRGKLVYCRLGVTAENSLDLRSFQERDPIFPNHSTVDQFFDHEQLEAYRRLGFETARAAYLELAERADLCTEPANPGPPTEEPPDGE